MIQPTLPELAGLHRQYAHTYILEDAYLSALAAGMADGNLDGLPATQAAQRAAIVGWRIGLTVLARRTGASLPADLQQAAGARSPRCPAEAESTTTTYTIVGAPALAQPTGSITHLNGFELRALSVSDRAVVTWRRSGHTCMLSAAGVPTSVLERLAAWRAAGVSG